MKAIFDIGKTNKKVLALNGEHEVIYQKEAIFPEMRFSAIYYLKAFLKKN